MTAGLKEGRVVSVNGSAFSYLEQGAGTALVLLHGIGSGAQSWKAQLAGLSESFRVLAWDAPGYADSAPLRASEPDASDYAERLRMLLEALDIEQCHLTGHSLGAIMAARFAREYPERVHSLTLAGPSSGHARLSESERGRLRSERLEDLLQLGPQGMAEKRGPRLVGPAASEINRRSVIETMSRVRPDGYRQAASMLSGADTRTDIAMLPRQVPLQVIIGDADVITPSDSTRMIAAERPDGEVHVLRGAGHAMYLEMPEAFNELLLQFVRNATQNARRDTNIRTPDLDCAQ